MMNKNLGLVLDLYQVVVYLVVAYWCPLFRYLFDVDLLESQSVVVVTAADDGPICCMLYN